VRLINGVRAQADVGGSSTFPSATAPGHVTSPFRR
jgi:hypothetical protein